MVIMDVVSCLGWHTGTAWVSKVQPIPVPMKPAPVQVWVETHTHNICGFHKTLQVPKNPCGYFIIFLFFHGLVLFFGFFVLFLVLYYCMYLLYSVVTT